MFRKRYVPLLRQAAAAQVDGRAQGETFYVTGIWLLSQDSLGGRESWH